MESWRSKGMFDEDAGVLARWEVDSVLDGRGPDDHVFSLLRM
jgi:hypothetical protein